MNSPQVHSQGYWLSREEGHFSQEQGYFFDEALAEELAMLLTGKSVCDLGCGMGKYVRWFRKRGFECDGFDGNPNTAELTDGECRPLNLAEPAQLPKQYDAVISLEVGEHIPRQYEAIFLDNIARHAKSTIVLSWAIPGQEGDGHVNCRANSHVIFQLWKRGFRFDPVTSMQLRANCSLDWLKHTLMAFSKRRSSHSEAEKKALLKIVLADIERLKRNNRSNSSLSGALAGKTVRSLLSVKDRATKFLNLIRLYRYDAARLLWPEPRDNDQHQPHRPLFFPVCFTCGKHFRFVRLALLSLAKCNVPIKRISIFMDRGDPLSILQRQQLQAECPHQIDFPLTQYPMASWGPKVQLSELQAYRAVAKEMSSYDFLVKFDSDVIFISSRIFELAADSQMAAIGTPVSKLHESELSEDYMQGGCYFIRAKELKQITAIPVARSSLAPSKWGEIPEDQFFSSLLRRCGAKPGYDNFLYFDPIFIASGVERSQLLSRLKAMPETAGVLHFEGNKFDRVDRSNMKVVAEEFFGPLPPILNPYH